MGAYKSVCPQQVGPSLSSLPLLAVPCHLLVLLLGDWLYLELIFPFSLPVPLHVSLYELTLHPFLPESHSPFTPLAQLPLGLLCPAHLQWHMEHCLGARTGPGIGDAAVRGPRSCPPGVYVLVENATTTGHLLSRCFAITLFLESVLSLIRRDCLHVRAVYHLTRSDRLARDGL